MTAISVVMPMRDAEKFLSEAISSVMLQTYDDLELLVVIDSSTDGSERIALKCADDDARIRMLRSNGKGLVDALNSGCEAARGSFIAQLDADDRMHATRLQRQVDFMQSNPDVVALGCPAIVIDERSRAVGRIAVPKSDAALRLRLVRGNPFVHSSMMLRRSALIAAGGYRNDFPLVEDLDLWLRVARCGRLANLSSPLVDYRRHPDAVSVRNGDRQRLAQHLCILEWKRKEGLIDELTVDSMRRDLVSLFDRIHKIDLDPKSFRDADLTIFRRLLPNLGAGEARRLRRLTARAGAFGRIGKTAAVKFAVEAMASRIIFDRRSRAAARRLSFEGG